MTNQNYAFKRRLRAKIIIILSSGALMLSFQNCSFSKGFEAMKDSEINYASKACLAQNTLLKPQLKRLTLIQFKNSLTSTFGDIFLESQFPNFNDSNPRIGLSNDPNILRINEVNFQSVYTSSRSLVSSILTQNVKVKACLQATDDSCIQQIITDFGLKLFRRPLSSLELADMQTGLTELVKENASQTIKVEFVLLGMILSPNHLFRTELGAPGVQNQALVLSDYEIASALSFAVWDYPPDDILLKLAAENGLHETKVLKVQIQRMLKDPRSKMKMVGFLTDVLKIDGVTSALKDPSFNLTNSDRSELLKSAQLSLSETYDDPSTDIMAPFYSTNFYVNTQTARYFNLDGAPFSATPIRSVVDANQRFGILSHPAFLTSISGEIGSGIVKRGVFTIEQLLCHELPAPPANVQPVSSLPQGFDPSLASSRELLTISHSGQQSCMGCHKTIDPVGFAFENYNPIGQYRLFEKDSVKIDSSGTISGLTAQPLTFANSVDFYKLLAQSKELKQCMTKKYFHYISGQSAQESSNQCEFNSFQARTSTRGETVQGLLETMIELESFTKRSPAGN